jgi:cell division protein FtsW
MVIAKRCKALFPAYLIMGLALMMVIQAMVNMAVDVGAMPVTGQPLPLISRGGTSTIVNCAYMGIMLSVSRSAKKIDEDSEISVVEEKAKES